MNKKTAIIIGAGPAGLTAAYELLTKTDIKPIVLEKSTEMGGISRTINYKGNHIDIGGHRFFSKSDRVMKWWEQMMPFESTMKKNIEAAPGKFIPATHANPDNIMLVRQRKSRIYYNRTFFDYPVTLSPKTLCGLGFAKTMLIGMSYFKQMLFPIKNEKNLEDFFINRFGKQLYLTFFKSYSEKLWGIPCNQISNEWGAQRVKGVSITAVILHFFKTMFMSKKNIAQKNLETSLIEQFLYPKYGPGQMWDTVAHKIKELGGEIITNKNVVGITASGTHATSVTAVDSITKEPTTFQADYVFSTMPVQNLVNALQGTEIPEEVTRVNNGLMYRDFITVGLLLHKLKLKENKKSAELVKDNWIYIQEPDVTVGRLQIFNNWSPYMVADPSKVWVGLEYFCFETDELWKKADKDMIAFAAEELERIDIIDRAEVIDATVIHQEKTYPAYFGTYSEFNVVQNFLDQFSNLFLIGRNGMHKYNNQDHSMLTAMTAVENIINQNEAKQNIWNVNTEQEYHEQK